MGNLVSKDKSKAHKIRQKDMLPKDRAILDLKLQRDKLKQYQKKIQLVLDKEVEVAKHHLRAGDQGRALLALKKKKYQERLLKQTDDQLFTLEQLTGQIEYSLVEQDVMKGLQQGNEILTMIHKEMSLDAVQRLMDDTADGIAYQAEINDLISGSISAEDEDEIMAQLDLLEAEETVAKFPAIPENTVPTPAIDTDALPDVPDTLADDAEEEANVGDTGTAPVATKTRQKQKERQLEEPLAA